MLVNNILKVDGKTSTAIREFASSGKHVDAGLRYYESSQHGFILYKKPLSRVPLWVFQKLRMAPLGTARATVRQGWDAYHKALEVVLQDVGNAPVRQKDTVDDEAMLCSATSSATDGQAVTTKAGVQGDAPVRARVKLSEEQTRVCLQAAVDELYCQTKGQGLQVTGYSIGEKSFGTMFRVYDLAEDNAKASGTGVASESQDDETGEASESRITRIYLQSKGFFPGQELKLLVDDSGVDRISGADSGHLRWFQARQLGEDIQHELGKSKVRKNWERQGLFLADPNDNTDDKRVAKKKEELMLDYLLRQEHFKRDLVFGKKTSAQDVSEARKAILEEVGQLVAAAQGRNKTPDLYKIVAQAFVKHVQKARHKKFLQELNTKYDRQVQLIEANRAAEGRTRVPHSPRKPIPVSGINKEVSAKLVVSKAQRFCERMQAIVDSLKDNNGRLDVLTQEQGFFRTGGSEKIVNQIVKNWSKNQDISVKALRNLDVKDRSTLIKRLIRDFPGLLLGANMSELKKVLCGPSKSAQEKHQAIEQHLSKLPVANQEFLELLMELCLFVETHKEQTSMTAENLVTSVLGSLFDDWTEPIDTMLVVKDIVDRKEAAQALFDYYKNLQITQTTLQEIR